MDEHAAKAEATIKAQVETKRHQERLSKELGLFFENWPCRRQGEGLQNYARSLLESAEVTEASRDLQARSRARQCLEGLIDTAGTTS